MTKKQYGRCIHKGAKYEDGRCKNYITQMDASYCKTHKDKQKKLDRETYERNTRSNNIGKYWNEAIELLDIESSLTLSDLFGFVKESFLEIDGIDVSLNFIKKWYKNTQGIEGHPVEVLDQKYPHLIGTTPYLKVMAEFGSETMPRYEYFGRERVKRFVKKNPDATIKKIEEVTGVRGGRIREFAKSGDVKIMSYEDKIKKYLEERPWSSAREISEGTGISTTKIYRVAKECNFGKIGTNYFYK